MEIRDIIHKDIDDVSLDDYVKTFAFLGKKAQPSGELSDYYIQNEKSKYLIAYESYRIVISILVIFAAILVNYVISAKLSVDYENSMKDSALFYCWPWNQQFMEQFEKLGRMQTAEQRQAFYWLSYLCSITNVILVLWTYWRFVIEFRRRDRMNVSGSDLFAAFKGVAILSIGCVVAFMAMRANFSTTLRFYTPSIDETPAVYSLKKVLEIFFFYTALGMDIFIISMMMRYRKS